MKLIRSNLCSAPAVFGSSLDTHSSSITYNELNGCRKSTRSLNGIGPFIVMVRGDARGMSQYILDDVSELRCMFRDASGGAMPEKVRANRSLSKAPRDFLNLIVNGFWC